MSKSHPKQNLLKRTAKLEKELAVKSYELKIESALEKVSIAAMSMRESKDLAGVGRLIFKELKKLGFTDLRNSEIIINNDAKETITSYYYSDYGVTGVIELDYRSDPIVHGWAKKLKKVSDAFAKVIIREKEMKQWRKYREEIGYRPDPKLNKVKTVYYYYYSIGLGALSISSFKPVSKEQQEILGRFRNVFNLSYRRYADIALAEAHVREAQVEAALERVRASSMAMHGSHELDKVIKEVTEQLTVLGFDFDASNITTDLTSEGLYVWNASPAQPIPSGVYIPYKDIDIINWVYSDWAFHEGIKIDTFNKAQKNAFFKHYFAHTVARNISDERKKYILDAKSLNLTFACRKDFALGLLNYRDINYTEEQNNILARFAKVFEQSYIRFLDLQKAEAQAREAHIEAGLERVRSHAMAMQTSEELNALIGTVFTELTKLDLVLTRCVIQIYEGNEKGVRWWMANSEAPSMPVNFFVKYADIPFFNEYLKGWEERSLKWQYILQGDNKFNTDEFLFKETELSQLPDFVIAGMRAPDRVYLNASFNNFGNLTLASLEPLSDEHFDILLRFAKVFDLTYTRFNDLKQAEAQAWEAQIQLALERVRARTMAMHRSEELAETAQVMFHQLQELGGIPDRIAIGVADEDAGVVNFWSTDQSGSHIDKSFKARLNERKVMAKTYKAWKDHKKSLVIDLQGDDVKEWIQFAREEMGVVVKDEFIKDRRVHNFAFFSHGWILVTTHEPQAAETIGILERFAAVFSLTYRRFLDLQKAEAQAREAHIEAALERVRARSMAMHHSSELHDAADVLFQQLRIFGGNIMNAGIALCTEDADKDEYWLSSDDGLRPVILIPHTEDAIQKKLYEDWKNKSEFYSIAKGGDELRAHYNYLGSVPHLKPFFEEGPDWSFPTWQKWHAAFFSHGYLFMITLEPYEEEKILVRFARVFEQAYTRFLDLQKAEAQAREAQIEAALERVRSSTMAMHKSEDLAKTAVVLFEQLNALGNTPDRISIGIIHEAEGVADMWLTDQSGNEVDSLFILDLNEKTTVQRLVKAWKAGLRSTIVDLTGEDLKTWLNYVREIGLIVKDEHFKNRRVHNVAFFSHGWLNISVLEPLSPDMINILERFASVYSLTYRRFLDLQKAETQAREAQIEAALEKVRSRSLAMHKSEELHEVVKLVLDKLKGLHINLDNKATSLVILNEEKKDLNFWLLGPDASYAASTVVPFTDNPVISNLWEAKKAGKIFFTSVFTKEVKDSYWKWAFSNTSNDILPAEAKQRILDSDTYAYSVALARNTGIFISSPKGEILSDSDGELLKRFANVFDQAYTRFLDLQKAEAQARESQIQLALERVRSRSLAMHKSDELSVIAKTMFEQLRGLGLELEDGLIIMLFREDSHDQLQWPVLEGLEMDKMFIVPYFDHPVMNEVYKARETGVKFIERHFDKTVKDDFLEKIFSITDYKVVPIEFQKKNFAGSCYHYSFAMEKFTGILMHSYNRESYPAEYNDILRRFTRVFEQSYIRFLDLQKAEANAREAQIETSLERVRSKTMAMHDSNDVGETVAAMFAEFVHLGIPTNRCGILIFNDQYVAEVWTARSTPGGNAKLIIGKLDLDAHKMLRCVYNAWKAKETFYQYDLLDNELVQYYTAINNSKFYPTLFDLNALPSKEFHSDFFFADGAVFSFTNKPVSEEHAKIIKRFALVFGQTYRRYLDLQKAEAQTREAQIEAALERVRSKAMAMHVSEDLGETIRSFYQQMRLLGLTPKRCGVGILDAKEHVANLTSMYTTDEGESVAVDGKLLLKGHSMLEGVYQHFLEQEEYYPVLRGNEIRDYYQLISPQISYPDYPQGEVQFGHFFFFPEGGVYAWTEKQMGESELNIYRRFTSVLSLTYKRYLDLKKAEAQAKEAQIETSLERVRSKTMAMHSSDDVTSATATMFTELDRLGIENMRCGIAHYLEDYKMEVWSVSNLADGKVVRGAGLLDTNSTPFWKIFYNTWQQKEDFLYYSMAGKEKEDYFKKISTLQNYLSQSIEDVPDLSIQAYYFPEGSVWAFSLKPHSEEDKQVMKRFASVFSLTFRRYQDLKKAEAQTREATIEAAMEKVRGKAMAMHNSNDLSVTASMVFTELKKLGINPIRCGVGLLSKESRKAQLYSATSSDEGDSLSLVGWVILSEHPVLEKIYESWVANEEYYPELQGEQMKSYYQLLLKGLPVAAPKIEDDKKQFGTFLPFSVGCLYAWSEAPYNETEIKILKRFATIIDLTFRRYMELQTSETNAREAVKQAALDRIRADIASMRTVADLDRITPLIWNELTILNIPFIRCGVFIMDNSQQLIHTFLSTPDGKAIGAFHLPYETQGNFLVMLKHWLDKKIYIGRWDEADFIAIAEILVQQGSIATREQYLNSLPKDGFYLHFLPFLQGMLYVGNTEKLNDEQIELIQHVADAFSTAYARYEDFNKLEAAKQQVEKTLTDLKQAQTQLVQSEKMASLGELTAGIAHEIQNPLNFVNNFSDVSNELLDEMKEELAKGNIDDAIAIAEDVKQNLEKINHHGKRADGIVKGMLQHSRTSSGQKEMTDINSLTDEYLRLAYHGLRAKEKSFNAKFETDFDNSVGKISVIPQDIGRVILNLINNAFYAISEKKKQAANGYEPTVAITTARENGKIEIKITDNGNGIPQKVVDKIFQPFFTTKPTGQGTGLGLSLAYDIIKAHGGEIKIKTKEGEGSEFTIELPCR